MIKLVQGFDVCSPLPIDGRILLSKKEMYEIDDNILPERYFAICKEDGKLYLYNKNNVITEETGRWRLADETLDERITEEVETLNTRIDGEVSTLNSRVDNEVVTLNTRVDNEVTALNTRVDSEVATLNETINSKESALQEEDLRLDAKIDNYKEDKQLVSEPELTATLAEYSLGDEAGTKVVLTMDTVDYILKLQLFNRDNEEVSSSEVNTPLEEFVIDADYDEASKTIILHLKNGHDVEIPIGSLIDGLISEQTFEAHVNNEDADHQHINAADRERWNTTSRDVVLKYNPEDADNPNSLYHQLSAGANTTIDTTDDNKVRINAVDTTTEITSTTGSITVVSSPTPGVPNSVTFDLNTQSSAPFWNSIQGDNPRDNTALDTLVSGIETSISNETSSREAADEELTTSVSDLNTALEAEVTRATTKEADLESRLGESSQAISDEETRATEKEAQLQAAIDNINDVSLVNLRSKDEELESSISAETSRATAKEAELTTSIADEAQNRANADTTLQQNIDSAVTRIQTIEGKIPNEASSTNQLADKDFVNSSIATSTAEFRGTKETKAEIKALTGNINDYAYLKVIDSVTGLVKQYDRYKYSETVDPETGNWAFEYTLNNSSFTSEQWAAINSGATTNLVNQITTNQNDISDLDANKVDKEANKSLINDSEITRLANIATGATKVTQSSNPGDGNILVTSRTDGVDGQPTEVNVYTHPAGSEPSANLGFYKLSTDSTSHVNSVENVTAEDITNLNPYVVGEGLESSTTSGVTTIKNKSISTVAIEQSEWVLEDSVYTAAVTLQGVTANSEPVVDVDLSSVTNQTQFDAYCDAWSKVFKATTSENTITFYALEKPTIDLSILVKGY